MDRQTDHTSTNKQYEANNELANIQLPIHTPFLHLDLYVEFVETRLCVLMKRKSKIKEI